MMAEPDPSEVPRGARGIVIPLALTAIAAIYLVAIVAECVKSGVSSRRLPAPLVYFAQTAALFTHAAKYGHDYRVEGYACADRRWAEIDVTPYFPMDAEHKENRFYRAIHFYYELEPSRPTMRALDEFIVRRYNGDAIDDAAAGRGSRPQIGGVRFVKIRLPFGKPGDGSARYERKPIDGHPAEMRKDLYWTPESMREDRCRKSSR